MRPSGPTTLCLAGLLALAAAAVLWLAPGPAARWLTVAAPTRLPPAVGAGGRHPGPPAPALGRGRRAAPLESRAGDAAALPLSLQAANTNRSPLPYVAGLLLLGAALVAQRLRHDRCTAAGWVALAAVGERRPAGPLRYSELTALCRPGQRRSLALATAATPEASEASEASPANEPPPGFFLFARVAVAVNAVAIPMLLAIIRFDPHLRLANLVLGLAAALPIAITGIVSGVAILQRRYWGVILGIVSLSLSLVLSLSYGIVRLALVAPGRTALGLALGLGWVANVALLVYWCFPMHYRYLKRAA